MREEIRLGNEALTQNDMETAQRHFQELLDNGGTPIQEQIATNRLREIRDKQKVSRNQLSSSKPRTRRKTTGGKTRNSS